MILILTSISTETEYIPPMDERGQFIRSPGGQKCFLVFNHGAVRIPVSHGAAEEAVKALSSPEPAQAQPISQSQEEINGAEIFSMEAHQHQEDDNDDEEDEDGVGQF